MAVALLGGIAALGSAGAGIFGAASAANAQSQQQQAVQNYQNLIAKELSGATGQADSLLASQQSPADIFKQIFGDLPGELSKAFPVFEGLSTDAAAKLTQANVDNWKSVINQIYPGWTALNKSLLGQINNLNPANLGTQEILGTTRAVSPLIPAGTLDPTTGSVGSGTTNPVSLYRNLVNGMYDQRRQEFIQAASGYMTNADNSAARQEVQAQQFMGELVSGSLQTSTALTGETVQQQQANINNAMAQIQTLLGLQSQGFNAAPYTSAISSGISSATAGLGSLAKLFSTPGSSWGSPTATPSSAYANSLMSSPNLASSSYSYDPSSKAYLTL
jgi:hypothetical protein